MQQGRRALLAAAAAAAAPAALPIAPRGSGVGRSPRAVAGSSPARYAWATIFYEAGRNDDEYFLGARVLMESVRQSGTTADRVMLVGRGTQARYLRGFRKDGLTVRWVDNIESPWGARTQRRFLFSLNKIALWRMKEYERVVYLDADVIVLRNADFLFRCGHFCAVFMNPISFHTALLVVKPSERRYQDMLARVRGAASFDGADQGFFNDYFQGMSAQAEWTRDQPTSEAAMNRLPIQYNMNHIYYYEKMRWGGVWGDASSIVTLTYPIMPIAKPWYWYLYPLFDMHLWWHRYRARVDGPADYPAQLCLLLAAPAVAHLLGAAARACERRCAARADRAPPGGGDGAAGATLPDAALAREGVWCVWGRAHCAAVAAGFALSAAAAAAALRLTPGITPPLLAWPLFLSYHLLLLSNAGHCVWIRLHGCRLRYDRAHYAWYAAAWALYLGVGALPGYPHGLVKGGVCLVLVPVACTAIMTALFKSVHDRNHRLLCATPRATDGGAGGAGWPP